jgi:hypothetical protein
VVRSLKHPIKILASGELTKKLTVHAHGFSAKAAELIESAGGSVVRLGAPAEPEPAPKSKPKRKPKPVAEESAAPAAESGDGDAQVEPEAEAEAADGDDAVAEATDTPAGDDETPD